MFDRRARPIAASVMAPLASGPLRGWSPLALTGAGLVVGLAAAIAAALGAWWLAVVLWLTSRLLDGLDGAVARSSDRSSDVGGYLDLCADITVYGAVPLGVAAGLSTEAAWVAAAFLVASFYLNTITWTVLSALLEKRAAGATANGETTSVTMPPGLIEGAETIVWFAAILVVPSAGVWLMASMAGAVAVGAGVRIVSGVRLLRVPVPVTVP